MSIADYGFAIWETFYVTVLSTAFALVLGLPLGVLLVAGDKDGVLPLPGWLMHILNIVINILRSVPFLILMTEGGENFAGIAVGCQGCAKVIYKSGVLVLLFIWDQDTDHVAGFLVGKSGNIGAAALYPADFLRFLQDRQCSPHGLAADPIAGA